MAQRKAWKALIQSTTYPVGGVPVEFGKLGVPRIATIVAGHPGVGDVIEVVMADRQKGKKTTVASLAKAASDAAEAEGLPAGKVARAFVAALPSLVVDLVTACVVVADEDERVDFRVWLESQDLPGTVDALMGFVKVNLPEAADPLELALAQAAVFVEDLPTWARGILRFSASELAPAPATLSEPAAA